MRIRSLVAVVALLALGVAGWLTLRPAPQAATTAAPAVSTTTAPVTVGDVAQRVQIAGVLEYDGDYAVINHLPTGILTRTAAAGSTVRRGGSLYTVSGTPVMLLYGVSAAYRSFSPGMKDGTDVRQLETNLAALGLDPGTVDNHFSAATAQAVRRWQSARRLPPGDRIGALRLGEVVFLPGAVRVHENRLSVGALAGPGAEVLSATSTTQVVTARLTTDRQHLVKDGDEVRVILPTGATVTARVTHVGRVAQTPAPGAGGQPTVPVTVALTLPDGGADLDQAPVQISITTAVRTGVMMVPVIALLAKTGGGYQVRVLDGGSRLVDVQPGLYDDTAGTVEVTADGLRDGMTVQVPQS